MKKSKLTIKTLEQLRDKLLADCRMPDTGDKYVLIARWPLFYQCPIELWKCKE